MPAQGRRRVYGRRRLHTPDVQGHLSPAGLKRTSAASVARQSEYSYVANPAAKLVLELACYSPVGLLTDWLCAILHYHILHRKYT